MDPNAALRTIRSIVKQVLTADQSRIDPLALQAAALEMSEAFDGLDEWLTRGGFLPEMWERTTMTVKPYEGPITVTRKDGGK